MEKASGEHTLMYVASLGGPLGLGVQSPQAVPCPSQRILSLGLLPLLCVALGEGSCSN